MGEVMVQELLDNNLRSSDRTPVGRCSNTTFGEFAPKQDGAICESFLNCLRCRNYVVTADDLWRLYSFYWRIFQERSRIGRHRWKRQFSHIPRLIERDVVRAGLARKVFNAQDVEAAKERARLDPHPFWARPTIISDLESLQ